MSLRTKISILLALTFGFVVCTSYAIQSWVILPAFSALEKSTAEQNVMRCIEAFEAEIEGIANLVGDWSAWDDNYYFAKGEKPDFIEGNLQPEAFANANMNLICVVNNRREIVWAEARDSTTLEPIDVPDLFTQITAESSPLLACSDPDKGVSGIIQTSHGPLMIASKAIITTDRKSPTSGWTLMGRFFNPKFLESLSERTHFDINAWQISSESMPESERQNCVATDAGAHPFLRIKAPDELDGYFIYNDLASNPAILFKLILDRQVINQGAVSANTATVCNLSGGLLALLVMWFFLSKQIVRPLQQLSFHAQKVGTEDDLDARLDLPRSDEIGTLANQLDLMVGKLADSRMRILDQAHRAGMAETAAEVLHNVGNAINSANCSAENIAQSLENSKLTGLGRAIELLNKAQQSPQTFFEQDPRAPKLIDYLNQVGTSLQQEHAENSREIDRIRQTIRHIREAVASKSALTEAKDFHQRFSLRELLHEVQQIVEPQLTEHGIALHVSIPEDTKLYLNRSQLAQVLLNLLRNSIDSISEFDSSQKSLKINVSHDSQATNIEIVDSGTGFDESVREQLFSQGFTTKTSGSGLGLHYCANVINKTGGSISAVSDGFGSGATFRVRLINNPLEGRQPGKKIESKGVSCHAS